jgi:hypothetical protein
MLRWSTQMSYSMRMTPEQFAKATRPKMLGGWNLHQLTMDDPIRNFVLFSSISTVLATPTQASYVASNCFLEALHSPSPKTGAAGIGHILGSLA